VHMHPGVETPCPQKLNYYLVYILGRHCWHTKLPLVLKYCYKTWGEVKLAINLVTKNRLEGLLV
jgi:hypothetical protein